MNHWKYEGKTALQLLCNPDPCRRCKAGVGESCKRCPAPRHTECQIRLGFEAGVLDAYNHRPWLINTVGLIDNATFTEAYVDAYRDGYMKASKVVP